MNDAIFFPFKVVVEFPSSTKGVPLCYCLCSIVHLYAAVVWNGILKANDLVN